MGEGEAVSIVQPKNLICNFRAPSLQQYQRWKAYVQWAKDNGQDVCHLTLSLTDSFMKGIEGASPGSFFGGFGRLSKVSCLNGLKLFGVFFALPIVVASSRFGGL